MSDAQKLIADVQREHHPVFDEQGHINGTVPGQGAWDCWCGLVVNTTFDECIDHASAEIDKALGGLTQEWTITGSDDGGEWIADYTWQERPTPRPGFFAGGTATPRWVSGWSGVQP